MQQPSVWAVTVAKTLTRPRPLLRLDALAKANASSMLELETWRSAAMDAELEGFEEAHALAHREAVSQFRVRA